MSGVSPRLAAWNRCVAIQNDMRAAEGLPPFDANLTEYAPMMAGFYLGYDAGRMSR